jgi:enamine deaminase RidA (YjgF/YER057c/UK114 family)
VIVDLSVSVDGFIASANDGPDDPLGDDCEGLFAWMNASEANRVHPFPSDPPPAITVHAVAGLGPGFLVEIDAIAVV